jgi:hypothetical protein
VNGVPDNDVVSPDRVWVPVFDRSFRLLVFSPRSDDTKAHTDRGVRTPASGWRDNKGDGTIIYWS